MVPDLVKYSIEELEVLKDSCEREIEEISQNSFIIKISRKIGADLYSLIRKALFVNLVIIVVYFIITFAFMFSKSPEEIADSSFQNIMILGVVIVTLPMMALAMLMGTDRRIPKYSKLEEINRVLNSKYEVSKRIQKQKKLNSKYEVNIDISDENQKRKRKTKKIK